MLDSTLELTTFEQEVWPTKISYTNRLSSGTNSCKKRIVATLNSAEHIKQKHCVTCVAGQNDSRALYIASSESCKPDRNRFGFETKLKEYIQEQQPEHGFCQKNGSERGQAQDWYPNEKNGGGTRLFEQQMLFFRVPWYCIVLTKIKAMILCLFWLFEEMLSMQFFRNIQRNANYPQAIQEFEISHQTFVMMKQKIVRPNQNAGVFRTSSSI